MPRMQFVARSWVAAFHSTEHTVALLLFKRWGEILVAGSYLGAGHIGVHVGDVEVHAPVEIDVEELDPHGAPRRFGEER